jgi:outer membrane biosynthesis protein TonB
MSFLKDKYKRRAALGTFLVHVFLVFIFYSFGLKYMDPKIEEGIAIEFGYVESGMGEEITQSEEIVTEVTEQMVSIEESTPEDLTEISDEVLTQDTDEAPSIIEEKEAVETQEKTPDVKEEEKPKASDELQKALSSLFQNTTTTQSGISDSTGAQGSIEGTLDGAVEAVGGDGDSSDGYELGDRKAIRKPKPNYSCNETGLVVIRVWVNGEGETYKAELDLKNTTDTSPCLVREAKAAALKTTWLADANAEPIQIGSIIYNFRKQ